MTGSRATLTWDRLIAGYLREQAAAGRSPQTIALRRAQLGKLARELPMGPEQVSTDDLVGFFAVRDWRPETRRSYRAAVVALFGRAHKHGLLDTDPSVGLPVMRQHVAPPRPAPDDAYQLALTKADRRARLMLRLAAEVGLRRGEVAAVHTGDLILGPRGWVLVVHGKGDRQRMVPVSDGLAAELIAHRTGWVFPNNRGGHLSAGYVGTLCSRLLPGLWTLHALRHRFATRAYRGSRNLRAVQTLLGHSSLAVTQRYLDVDETELRAAMQAAA